MFTPASSLRLAAATFLLSLATVARAQNNDAFSGALFTSTATGTTVNANHYARGQDVYLNGGPQNQAAAGLPDGIYYFQVTDPSGAVLLSLDPAEARQVVVVDGRVAGAADVPGAHADGVYNPANGTLGVQLWPFAQTPNGGGEYKAWLIRQGPATTIDPVDPRVLSFVLSNTKTDNFKVETIAEPLALTAPADITTCNDAKRDGAAVLFPAAVTRGGVAPVTITYSHPMGSFFELGTTTVVATAIDAEGSTATASFSVTVNDCEGPRFAAGSAPVYDLTLPADACAVTVAYDSSLFTDASGVAEVSFTPASGSAFPVGLTSVSYRATDSLGNVSEGSFVVTVADTTAPVIGALADIAVSTAPGSCSAVVNFAPVATDCNGATVSTSVASGTAFAKGTTPVVVTAVDAYGNTATATFSVTVNDTEAPVLTLPASVTLSNDAGKCSAVFAYTVGATDNCGPVEVTVSGLASGVAFPKGTSVVSVTAVDSSGNVATGSFTVTVEDTELPTIAAPADLADLLRTIYGTTLAVGTATASDNCGAVVVTAQRSDGRALTDPYPLGVTTLTWTAVDASGNTRSVVQTVTITGGSISAARFYDANASTAQDLGEALLNGWKLTLTGVDSAGNPVGPIVGATGTDFTGLPVGTYTVTLAKSTAGTWVETLSPAQTVTLQAGSLQASVSFGGFATGAGGGLTLGFWSNKNGERTLNGALAANLGALSSMNLRTATGGDFNPTSFATYNTWLLSAKATNMAYMLSAQLSAMYNNVNVRPNAFGGVNGSALIYAPGARGANASGVMTVSALLLEANASLAANAVTISLGAVRDYQTALKNALDEGNNNRNFVQAAPVPFSF